MNKLFILCFALLIFLCAAPSMNANLITNPGFETGDFTGWTVPSGGFLTQVVCGMGIQHSGNCAAELDLDSLYPNIATVAGQLYDLDFWYDDTQAATLDVFWGDTEQTATDVVFASHAGGSYIHVFVTGLLADSSSMALVFGASGPSISDISYLDDVNLVAETPEPSEIIVLLIAFAGILAARRVRIVR